MTTTTTMMTTATIINTARMGLIEPAFRRLARRLRRRPTATELARAESWTPTWVKAGLRELEAAGRLDGIDGKTGRTRATPKANPRAPNPKTSRASRAPSRRRKGKAPSPLVAERRQRALDAGKALLASLGRPPTNPEIAEALGLPAVGSAYRVLGHDLGHLRATGLLPRPPKGTWREPSPSIADLGNGPGRRPGRRRGAGRPEGKRGERSLPAASRGPREPNRPGAASRPATFPGYAEHAERRPYRWTAFDERVRASIPRPYLDGASAGLTTVMGLLPSRHGTYPRPGWRLADGFVGDGFGGEAGGDDD